MAMAQSSPLSPPSPQADVPAVGCSISNKRKRAALQEDSLDDDGLACTRRLRPCLPEYTATLPPPLDLREKHQSALLHRFPVGMMHARLAAGYCLRRDRCFETFRAARGHMCYLHRHFPHVIPCALMRTTPQRACLTCRKALLQLASRRMPDFEIAAGFTVAVHFAPAGAGDRMDTHEATGESGAGQPALAASSAGPQSPASDSGSIESASRASSAASGSDGDGH